MTGTPQRTEAGAPAGRNLVVDERRIAASAAEIWRALTDPERFARWWGPEDLRVLAVRSDPTPGGRLEVDQRYAPVVDHPETAAAFAAARVPTEVRARGRFLAVEPERRIAFRLELRYGTNGPPQTHAFEFRLTADPTGCRVRLEMEGPGLPHWRGLADPAARALLRRLEHESGPSAAGNAPVRRA